MARKTFNFSRYIDENGITTNSVDVEAEGGKYRYYIRIPFVDSATRSGNKAVVIMKNPSKAGKFDHDVNRKLSDDTVYAVLDYLYKHEQNFSEVIILNLFAFYDSKFNNAICDVVIFGNESMGRNNQVILETVRGLREGDRVIAAWGGYPKRTEFRNKYRERIKEVLVLLENVPLWRVGEIVEVDNYKFPQHGLQWVDFEDLVPFNP